jgi:signal transduction histidine kinase
LSAVLLSGGLTFAIYLLVARLIHADMRAKELLPIAHTVAEMTANTQDGPTAGWPFPARENKPFGADLHIFDRNGQSLMDTPIQHDGFYPNDDLPDRFILSDADTLTIIGGDLDTVLAGQSVTEIKTSAAGDTYLVVGVPVYAAGTSDDTVISGAVFFTQTMQELDSSQSGLNLTLLISTAVAFLLMLIPAFLATRRLVIPIRQMSTVARAMATGDFTVRADSDQKGEIGELGQAMNHFATASARLEQTRRDYVANVSHELRTPIASIRAMGETLQDGMAKSEDKKNLFYHNIVRESLRLSRLVDDLLELSRLQAGTAAMQKVCFDLQEILQNVADTYGYAAEDDGVTFLLSDCPRATLPVYSNPDRIEQVLVILLDNAVKHTPQGGTITLSAQATDRQVMVSVINSGVTIPPDDLPFIFERFYKIDKAHSEGGNGLGLSIAHEIIRGLDENIRVESANGITRFIFSISAAPPKTAP